MVADMGAATVVCGVDEAAVDALLVLGLVVVPEEGGRAESGVQRSALKERRSSRERRSTRQQYPIPCLASASTGTIRPVRSLH